MAICDSDILGRTLKQGKMTFHVHEKFYKGSLVTLDEAIDLIKQSTIVNMVGEKIVAKAIEKRLVHPDAVLRIDDVPHAQIVKM